MSDLDLDAAVEAAARVMYESLWAGIDEMMSDDPGFEATTWENSPSLTNKNQWRAEARAAIEAAAPLIEAQVRERIAAEILAEHLVDKTGDPTDQGYDMGIDDAAKVARGGAR